MAADPAEGMARVGWAIIYEMIDDHRELAAKTDDAELAAMLLKDAAIYEADVLKRARAAWAYALTAMMEPGSGPLRAAFGGDPRALECWQAGIGAYAFLRGLGAPQERDPADQGPRPTSPPQSAISGAVRGSVPQ